MKLKHTSHRASSFHAAAKTILLGLVLAGAADWLAPLAGAATHGWTGAASRFWSNPNNWTSGEVPRNGDELFFHSETSNRSMINDLTDLRILSLFFGAADYDLSGNELTVTREIECRPHDTRTYNINCPLHLSADRVIISVDNLNGGLLFESTTELNLNGPIVIGGTVVISQKECDSSPGFDTRVHITGPISGTGNLSVALDAVGFGPDCGNGGDSYLEFKGLEPNSFRGNLSVGGGFTGPGGSARTRVFLDKPDGVAVVGDGARLVIERDGDIVFQSSEQIGDNAEVEVQSGGALQLRNFFETIGTLTLRDNNQLRDLRPPLVDTGIRVLTLNGGLTCLRSSTNFSDVPTIRGVLNLTGFLPFHIDGSPVTGLDIEAQITGPGGFVKTGNSTLRLYGANTFTDEVVVSDGVVEVRHNLALGTSAGGVSLAGGGLVLRGVTIGNEALLAADSSSSLVAFGTCTWSGSITLNRQLTILGDDLSLPGAISGTGDLVLLGTAIELSGPSPNTFTGATVANCDLLTLNKTSAGTTAFGGALLIGQDSFTPKEVRWLNHSQVGRVDTPVTLGPQALMNLNGHHDTIGSLTFRGGTVQNSGTATLGLLQTITARVATATASINGGRLAIALGQRSFHVEDGAPGPDLSITAAIVDAGGITKTGPGTLLLGAANSFAGPVLINEGVVHVQNNTSLGTTGAGTTVADGATLQIEFVGALAEPLTSIQGAGHGGTLGVLNLMGATGVGVNLFMAGPSAVRVDSSFAILGGAISGTGPFTKVGAGTLQFGGGGGPANTFTGDTFVEEGILVLSKGVGVTTVPGHLIIGGGGGLFGASAIVRHFAGFTIGGGVTLNRGGVWDLNGNSESFSAAELQGRPALTLNVGSDVQTGVGTLTLPVGGDVVVNPGTFPGASSSISGHLALDPGPHRFIVQRGASGIGIGGLELDVSAVISQTSAAADIVKEGLGNMRLGGANSFTGPVTVNEGKLTAANALALGTAAGGTFVNNNASLVLDGGFEVEGETLTLESTNANALLSLGPVTNTWSGNIVLERTAGIRVTDALGAFTHFGGVSTLDSTAVSGPGGFTKSGPGALFITGLQGGNSYTGPTTVTDGLLEALRRGSLSGTIVVTGANSTLRTARATGLFPARTVLPIGASMAVQDGALWAMNGTNFETISRLVGDGRLTVSTGGALTVSNSVSCEFSGPVSGSGALNKYGLATLHVTGSSPDYTGPATVFDGTYKVDGYFPISPVTVKISSILRGYGAVGDVTVENGGVVRVDPGRPGQLGGEMQMNSANFQNGGVLGLAIFGPHPTAGNDRLFVLNAVTLTSPTLSSGFNYPPREGDVITLIDKIAAGAVSGAIGGFPEGAVRLIGSIPVVTSYVGGDGNDVTLTVTNLPLRAGGSQLVSSSSGNMLVPDDCSQLRLVVTNRSSTTITNLRGTLRSLTDGVVVTIAESAFPNLAPNARGTNAQPFQIRTEAGFSCGAGAEFELILTASNAPPIAIVYTFVGAPGYSLQFDGRDDQVEVPANTFSGVVNNFTIELWANPTANRAASPETNAGISVLLSRPNQRFAVFPDRGNLAYGATHVSAGLSIGGNGISVFEHGTNRVLGATHLPSRLVYSNAVSGWTHVALVYASRQPQLYVNGALVRSGAASIFSSVHPSGSLGGSSQADYGNFEGQLDEVRIWNVALNQSQIQTNMTRRLAGTEPNLVTYFRADEGGGILLTDSAPASPNPSGTLLNGAAFALADSAPITPPDADCLSGGACESCVVVSGQFDTNALESVRRIAATGAPSVCDPPKPCPGFQEFPDSPVRHVLHHFTNSTAAELCVTAQLRLGCSNVPANFFGVAAYAGEFRINQPCSNYLGDDGAAGPAPPPFSFRVPPRTNFLLVVTARTPDLVCDTYTLELFGVPCPPPTLHIAKDTVPDKVRLDWSSAYPDYRLQSVNTLDGSGPHNFGNISTPPVLIGGKFAITNAATDPRQFFRLAK